MAAKKRRLSESEQVANETAQLQFRQGNLQSPLQLARSRQMQLFPGAQSSGATRPVLPQPQVVHTTQENVTTFFGGSAGGHDAAKAPPPPGLRDSWAQRPAPQAAPQAAPQEVQPAVPAVAVAEPAVPVAAPVVQPAVAAAAPQVQPAVPAVPAVPGGQGDAQLLGNAQGQPPVEPAPPATAPVAVPAPTAPAPAGEQEAGVPSLDLCRVCEKQIPSTCGEGQANACACNRCICLGLIADEQSEALICGHVASLGSISDVAL